MAEAAVTTRLKKLINTPETEVKDAMAGMAAAHADLIRVEYDPNVIIRKDAPRKGKVGLVSGGGSGHEPMHGGYVGLGMLDAACPGAVFTSPTPDQMARATAAVDGGAGVLHIVKNYTGDILNFEMAAELARGEGAKVNAVITNDDVAVQDSLYTAGRRGVGVTVLVEKIAGGAAEAGADLDTVTELAKKVNANGRSMGMALTSAIVPAAGKPTFEISDDEMELGIGIHGEPGRERTKLKSADEIAEILTMAVVNDIPFKAGDEVLAFVNGMGGTPLIELYVVYNAVHRYLTGLGAAIGDGDHGINMDRGFQTVLVKLAPVRDKDAGTLLKTTGMALVGSVGGAGGPLYGTFFLRAGAALDGKSEISDRDLVGALEAGLKGVVERGKANPNDKTMVDALTPAVARAKESLDGGASLEEALAAAADAAEEGMKATIPLKALKGRASYLGDRSIGHQDPGATSSYLLLRALSDSLAALPQQAKSTT